MDILTLLIAIIALVVAVAAYVRTGGTEALKRQAQEALDKTGDALSHRAEEARKKTANAVGRMEEVIRPTEGATSEPGESGSQTPERS